MIIFWVSFRIENYEKSLLPSPSRGLGSIPWDRRDRPNRRSSGPYEKCFWVRGAEIVGCDDGRMASWVTAAASAPMRCCLEGVSSLVGLSGDHLEA